MSKPRQVYVYEDSFGRTPHGSILFPVSLTHIKSFLGELLGDSIGESGYFNANIDLYLDLIFGYFHAIRSLHAKAVAVHNQYRTQGKQYCVYLRSFFLSGGALYDYSDPGNLMSYPMYSSEDRRFREELGRVLPASLNRLTFFNLFETYQGKSSEAKLAFDDFPSFRALSHNWKAAVRTAVRGAKLIVLHLSTKSEGVTFELEAIREAGLAGRAIVIGAVEHAELADFAAVLSIAGAQSPELLADRPDFREAIASLAEDDFIQNNVVDDLSELPCFVVDREIEYALAAGVSLREVDYQDFIPSSLLSNWEALSQEFPALVNTWREVEAKYAASQHVPVEHVANTMISALRVFCVATTLERYHEMAVSLATVGIAHRIITRTNGVMAHCYGDAANYAAWSGDGSSSEYYANIARELALSSRRNR